MLQTMQKTVNEQGESVQVFFSGAYSVVNQIRSFGEELMDYKVVERALRSLPSKFDHVVATIEESNDLTKYSLQQLMWLLQVHEQLMNKTSETTFQQAFQSKFELKKF